MRAAAALAARLSPRLRCTLEYCLVIGWAAGWFVVQTGGRIALPRNTAWLLDGDWAATWHGWLFFTGGGWTLPPGLTPDLLHPHGSSVFYTNSVFWLAVPAKLVEPLFGAFQLYGVHLALAFIGVGVVGLWFFRRLDLPPAARIFGAALLVTSPVVVARFGHLALTAQWIVLLAVVLALDSVHEARRARRNAILGAAAAVFAVGLEAYLAAVAAPVALAGLVIGRLRGGLRWWQVGALAAAMFAGMGAMLWLAGAFTGGAMNRTAEGFGDFSSDLTTLFNPDQRSRWLPGLPIRPRQGEGFGYLGAGVLALCVLSAAGALRGGRSTLRVLALASPLIVVCVAEAVYALSPRVSFGGQVVAEWWAPFKLLGPLPSMFRGTGRFIWSLHWLLMVAAVAGTVRLVGRRWAFVPLAVALVAQATEIPPKPERFRETPLAPLGPSLSGIGAHYRHLRTVPVQVQWICPFDHRLVAQLSRLAYEEDLTLNSGLAGRYPDGIATQCRRRHEGPLDERTVYLPAPGFEKELLEAGARCGAVDRLLVCVAATHDTPLSRRLRGGAGPD